MSDIQPTVGRKILYRPPADQGHAEDVRFSADIAWVNEDNTINIAYLNQYGLSFHACGVVIAAGNNLAEPGQCEWMKYQKGQAAKTEELEEQLSDKPDAAQDFIDQATGKKPLTEPTAAEDVTEDEGEDLGDPEGAPKDTDTETKPAE